MMPATKPAVTLLKQIANDTATMRKLPLTSENIDVRPKLLSVSSIAEDYTDLRQILVDASWHISCANSCETAFALLSNHEVTVIVCERDLPDGTWRDIIAYSAGSEKPPLVIVTSVFADDRLWSEVLNLGGYDVLAKPFHEQEVRHVLASAMDRIERSACTAA
jgi:DNA-binding response OmpR family regulator